MDGRYTNHLWNIQPGEFTIEHHLKLPKYMADGHYVIDLKLHEPYSQDFFLAPDCQNLRIEGFYEPFSRSLVFPNEGFIGLESTLIQEEK